MTKQNENGTDDESLLSLCGTGLDTKSHLNGTVLPCCRHNAAEKKIEMKHMDVGQKNVWHYKCFESQRNVYWSGKLGTGQIGSCKNQLKAHRKDAGNAFLLPP